MLRIAIYLVVITGPAFLSATLKPQEKHEMHGFVEQFASTIALVAFPILAMQFVLSARIRWVEWPFGMDIVYLFHRGMGIFAGILLLFHPLLMSWGRAEWNLLIGWKVEWSVYLGRLALLLLLTTIIISVGSRTFRLPFEKWRRLHNWFAMGVLCLGLTHSLLLGGDLTTWPMRLYWGALAGVAISAYTFHQIVRARRVRKYTYEVVQVQQESPDVWSVSLQPSFGVVPAYLPGQFHFLTLHREGLPDEEHPFTIASSPIQNTLISTIKASGDFTTSIGDTRPGYRVSIRGPFGRFCHLLHPEELELVFVIGGIGITPAISMLRYMRDSGHWKPTVLLYNNRRQCDIVFREELDQMVSVSGSRLKVVHVLSKPEKHWTGETGHINRDLLLRHVSENLRTQAYYVCGPPQMSRTIIADLQQIGVSEDRIHTEMFAL
jgi:3-phenylpropionate/trans-cinnamate dioxygenase ferredoxin reductase subunit